MWRDIISNIEGYFVEGKIWRVFSNMDGVLNVNGYLAVTWRLWSNVNEYKKYYEKVLHIPHITVRDPSPLHY